MVVVRVVVEKVAETEEVETAAEMEVAKVAVKAEVKEEEELE